MKQNNEVETPQLKLVELRKWIRVLTIVFILLTLFPHFINNMVGYMAVVILDILKMEMNELASFSIFMLETYPYFQLLVVGSIVSAYFVFRKKATTLKSIMVPFSVVCVCMILSYSSAVLMFLGVYLPWIQMGPIT